MTIYYDKSVILIPRRYGFLRETIKDAIKAGIDPKTNLHRNGLEQYLEIIFPEVNDWIHDKTLPKELTGNIKSMRRPDYRSETLKMIVEFDGLPHYTNPDIILNDVESTKFYESFGYKVIRIPYFIQLTNKAVKQLFNRDVKESLFPEHIASLTYTNKNTPAYLCPMGIERMKQEFKKFPQQYKINKQYLIEENNIVLTRVDLL